MGLAQTESRKQDPSRQRQKGAQFTAWICLFSLRGSQAVVIPLLDMTRVAGHTSIPSLPMGLRAPCPHQVVAPHSYTRTHSHPHLPYTHACMHTHMAVCCWTKTMRSKVNSADQRQETFLTALGELCCVLWAHHVPSLGFYFLLFLKTRWRSSMTFNPRVKGRRSVPTDG